MSAEPGAPETANQLTSKGTRACTALKIARAVERLAVTRAATPTPEEITTTAITMNTASNK